MKLECPITMCTMEDPISTPCGHTFDRESLTIHFSHNKKNCPICRANLEKFDPTKAAKCFLIAEIINERRVKRDTERFSLIERIMFPLTTSVSLLDYFFNRE